MEIDTSTWKEFRIGGLFTVELAKGDIKFDEMALGNVALVSSGETNNGIVGYISSIGDGKSEIFPSNRITVDMFGNAFYQSNPFYAVSHGRVNILNPKFDMTDTIGLFITSVIKQEQYKYSYGRAVYSSVAENIIIKLPATPTGEPDWQYMEDFIKSLHHKPLTTQNKAGQAPDLNIDDWGEFNILELFGEVKIAKSADIGNLEEGTTPFVGRTDVDNGIQGFVNPSNITKGNCITISMVGTNVALYQKNDFQASQNIAILRRKTMTKEMAFFICSIINFEMALKYSYGRTVSKSNIEQMLLKLPKTITSTGEIVPDWQFMEDYIKSLPYGDRLGVFVEKNVPQRKCKKNA